MIERRSDNSIGFAERALTATIITLLLVGYQKMLPITTNTPSFTLDLKLEELP